jgi:membrane protein YdbS with pleckstrin-like domain
MEGQTWHSVLAGAVRKEAAMDTEKEKPVEKGTIRLRPHKNVAVYWLVSLLSFFLFVAAYAGAIWIGGILLGDLELRDVAWEIFSFCGIVWAVMTGISYLHFKAFARRLEYTIGPDAVTVKRGILWRSTITIPFSKIASVRVLQGPVSRLFGIGHAIVHTAGKGFGSFAPLWGLENYKEIRDEILERVTALQKRDRFGE